MPGNRFGGWIAPIGGHNIPEDGYHAEVACGLEHDGPPCAEWRAKESEGLASDLLERAASANEFLFNAAGQRKSEIGMAPGVVADEMAGGNDAADKRRLRAGMAANEEECGVNAVVGQDIEQTGCPGRIGSIVEGEGEFAWKTGRNEGFAEDPRGRPESSVSAAAGGKGEPGSSP